jgi:TusE/DsrC/DsvC family sulfur relay protein
MNMPTMTFTGLSVDVTDDGFFTNPGQWKEEMAREIAAREGIGQLTDDHWKVIRYMRSRYLGNERPPTARFVSKHFAISVRQVYQLFPKRPMKVAAKIAGVPEPRMYLGGCGVNWGNWSS